MVFSFGINGGIIILIVVAFNLSLKIDKKFINIFNECFFFKFLGFPNDGAIPGNNEQNIAI